MKNKLLIVCAGFLLLLFLVFGTYAWYLYFLRASGNYNITNTNGRISNAGIVFQDDGNNVYDSNAESLEDTEISKVPSYEFKVTNFNNRTSTYNLYIEDLPISLVNDGCTEKTLLNRSQLKYQLSLNGKVIKEDNMENIKDNLLDTRSIDSNVTNNYSLKVYIHEDAEEWIGKHYHYKVTLSK